jgi:methionyl-tRNA synthetase
MSEENSHPVPPVAPVLTTPPEDPRISIEDFARVNMQVGQVLEAEKVEGSRKLIRLKVDIGTEVRQVVAGIAEAYEPETLRNRKVVVVTNLKPARLMGVESNGMIVAASVDGRPVLATFAEDVPNGTRLK